MSTPGTPRPKPKQDGPAPVGALPPLSATPLRQPLPTTAWPSAPKPGPPSWSVRQPPHRAVRQQKPPAMPSASTHARPQAVQPRAPSERTPSSFPVLWPIPPSSESPTGPTTRHALTMAGFSLVPPIDSPSSPAQPPPPSNQFPGTQLSRRRLH